MTRLINTEKAFDKFQHDCMIKNAQQNIHRKEYSHFDIEYL